MHSKSEFRNSIVFTISFAAAVALLVLLVVVASRAQNPVPPTAREAAASPAFAGKLHPATRPKLNKPQAAAHPRNGQPLQYQLYYDNGPANGTTDAWTINFGYIVSDTFVADNGNSVTSFDLYVWEFPGDVLTSVDWSITSAPVGGTVYGSGTVSGSSLTDAFISTNQNGYDIDKISASGLNVSVTQGSTYWFNLQNAVIPSGDPVFWDENSGKGCHSQGCPSQATESAVGTIPSEAFDINGGYPPPPCFESEENMQIIHDFNSYLDGGKPSGGVAADPAGNVYGAMSGGSTGFGFVYQIAGKNQGWPFNILYNFTGGSDGGYPNPPMVGPHGILYGTAAGESGGLVYSLRPAPTACLTALCSWTENVLYEFSDNNAFAENIAAFDQQGNLYGFSGSGGKYGNGAVFELTPSPGGWTETVLYSFTGGSDGGGPDSVLVGQDNNLYGAAGGGGANNAGVVFQLVRPPSGGNWTENVIYTFSGQSPDGGDPRGLVQDGGGNLLGFSGYYVSESGTPHIVLFMLSPSKGSWVFAVLEDIGINPDYGEKWTGSGLATDTAGNAYWADAYFVDDGTANWAGGGVFMRPPGGNWYTLWDVPYVPPGQFFWVEGTLGIDASGNVYGTTSTCGKYGLGTVWKVSP